MVFVDEQEDIKKIGFLYLPYKIFLNYQMMIVSNSLIVQMKMELDSGLPKTRDTSFDRNQKFS